MQVTSLACDQMSFRGRCSVPGRGKQAANWRGQASLLLGSSAAAACEREAPSLNPRIGQERMVRCNPTKRLGAVFAGACLTNPQAGASTKPDHQGLSGKSSTSSKVDQLGSGDCCGENNHAYRLVPSAVSRLARSGQSFRADRYISIYIIIKAFPRANQR